MVYIEITGKVLKSLRGASVIRSTDPTLSMLHGKKVKCQITEIEETTISSDVEITEMKEL